MRRIREVFCLFAALLASACNGDVVYGNGEPATEARLLADFVRVDAAGSMDVVVERGEAFEVAVSIDSNLLPLLRTRVIGDSLVIDSEPDFEAVVGGPHVTVVLPNLHGATLSGSGQMAIFAPQPALPVGLELSGSGGLSFEGSAAETTVLLSGSGDVALTGSSERIELVLAGSGGIDATRLAATHAELQLSGSGNIRANVSGPVDVDLSGSGDIYLFGAPDVRRSSVDGSGQLHTP